MVAGGDIAIRPSTASIPSSVTVVVSCSPFGSCTIPFDASSQGYFRCSDSGKGSRNGQKAKSRTGLRACYQRVHGGGCRQFGISLIRNHSFGHATRNSSDHLT